MKHRLVVIVFALMFASCSAGETTSTKSAEAAEKQLTQEDPYIFDYIPDAQTTFAKNETEIFTGTYGYNGDLILPNFSCEAISRVTLWNVNVCALGGTSAAPFALERASAQLPGAGGELGGCGAALLSRPPLSLQEV